MYGEQNLTTMRYQLPLGNFLEVVAPAFLHNSCKGFGSLVRFTIALATAATLAPVDTS